MAFCGHVRTPETANFVPLLRLAGLPVVTQVASRFGPLLSAGYTKRMIEISHTMVCFYFVEAAHYRKQTNVVHDDLVSAKPL